MDNNFRFYFIDGSSKLYCTTFTLMELVDGIRQGHIVELREFVECIGPDSSPSVVNMKYVMRIK